MARAHRHFIPGLVWHLTHRCHKREFLLKFEPWDVWQASMISPGSRGPSPLGGGRAGGARKRA